MPRLSYLTETVLSNKITRNRIFLSFKDSPKKPLGRSPLRSLPPSLSCSWGSSLLSSPPQQYRKTKGLTHKKEAANIVCLLREQIQCIQSGLYLPSHHAGIGCQFVVSEGGGERARKRGSYVHCVMSTQSWCFVLFSF